MTIARTWRSTERSKQMAKKAATSALLEPNTTVQPTVERQVPESGTSVGQVQESGTSPPSNVAEVEPIKVEKTVLSVLIDAPMTHCDLGYATADIDFNGMTTRQAAAYKRLSCSLDAGNYRIPMRGGRYPSGKVCQTPSDAIRWLLEQLANAYEESTGDDITEGLRFEP